MTEYTEHHVRMDIMVIAKDQAQADTLVEQILNQAVIYGRGQATYAQDHNMRYARVSGFRTMEEEESFEDFMKRYREECGEPLLVDENGKVVENKYKTKRRK